MKGPGGTSHAKEKEEREEKEEKEEKEATDTKVRARILCRSQKMCPGIVNWVYL